jgi:hypothetical protein
MDLVNIFFAIKNTIENNLLALLLCILFFLLIRELVTWYWKINRIVNLLERIEKNTRKEQGDPEKEKMPGKRPWRNYFSSED